MMCCRHCKMRWDDCKCGYDFEARFVPQLEPQFEPEPEYHWGRFFVIVYMLASLIALCVVMAK